MYKTLSILAFSVSSALAFAQIAPLPPVPPVRPSTGPIGLPTNPKPGTLELTRNDPAKGVAIASITVKRGNGARQSGVAGTADNATVTFTGLPPNTMVNAQMDSTVQGVVRAARFPHPRTRCLGESVSRFPNIQRTDSAGRVTFDFAISHTTPAREAVGIDIDGPCVLRAGLSFQRSGSTQPEIVAVQSAAYDLPIFVEYRYDRTAGLTRFFDFRALASGAGQACSGQSSGPQNFTVGPVVVNGDLALRIRSGPLGTRCTFVSDGIKVTDELTLTDVEWEVARTSTKCCVGAQCSPSIFQPGHVPTGGAQSHTSHGSFGAIASNARTVGANPPAFGPGEAIIGFAHARMECDATAVNDHGATVILKSAVFRGPPNIGMPR